MVGPDRFSNEPLFWPNYVKLNWAFHLGPNPFMPRTNSQEHDVRSHKLSPVRENFQYFQFSIFIKITKTRDFFFLKKYIGKNSKSNL